MTLEHVFLGCFLIGFLLSLVSVLTGHLHLHVHGVHAPHFHAGHGHIGMTHGHIAAPAGGHGAVGGHGGGNGGTAQSGGPDFAQALLAWFNFSTISAFLAWFGGAGFLATHYYGIKGYLAIAVSMICGVAGAAIIFALIGRVVREDEALDPRDFDMVGVLGTISNSIRSENGIGEILFTQQGSRKAVGARSEDGTAIPKGTEVIVTRYERGIAYVKRWDELTSLDVNR